MFLRKIACCLIKLLGGYTPLEYEAKDSLYKKYKDECLKYRLLVGPLEKAEALVDAIDGDIVDLTKIKSFYENSGAVSDKP